MEKLLFIFLSITGLASCSTSKKVHSRVFDVHLHGSKSPQTQLDSLIANGVSAIAISTSWPEQQQYKSKSQLRILKGLFLPCPNGKVPYSQQPCFTDGKEWPEISWVEQQIKEGKIDFIGEVLTQYYGISSSDTLMHPYYALAERYQLPVGIHTGSAGPNHGSPGFKEEMGNPVLLSPVLLKFPRLKVWLMHGGAPFVKECIGMMTKHPNLYADISVLNNSNIVPAAEFQRIIQAFIAAGLEDRLMFGSDNAPVRSCIDAVNRLSFLTAKQKRLIFFQNAQRFF